MTKESAEQEERINVVTSQRNMLSGHGGEFKLQPACTLSDVKVTNNKIAVLEERLTLVTSPGDKFRQHRDELKLYLERSEADIEVAEEKVAEESSKYSGGKNVSANPEQAYAWQPTPVSNRFSELSHFPNSVTYEDGMTPLKREKVTHYKNYHKEGSKSKGDKRCVAHTNCIPTLVNGQVNREKKEADRQPRSDKSHIQRLLREAEQKLVIKKRRFSSSREHKLVLIGDSHLRGCAANMKNHLKHQFEVCGYVKPGASFKSVMKSAKSESLKLTMEDFLVVSSGANDASRNDLRNGFCEVISFVKSVDQTNVILVGIPHRYDLGSSQINSEIEIYNRKLDKLAKTFTHVNVVKVDSNRQQYTTHGQHLSGLGKELLSSNLLLHIYSTLEKVRGPTIALAWRDNYSQGNSLPTTLDNQDMIYR
jgi:hypothetical protein